MQIKRETGLTYKSALFLMYRIRWAMAEENPPKLSGIIEGDEPYVGGKPRQRHGQPKPKKGRGTKKVAVVALV